YVGKSKAMIARINTHRRAWIDRRQGRDAWITDTLGIPGLRFDEIHIRPCPPHLLDAVEREMIDKYKPRYNKLLQTRGISAPITLKIGDVLVGINQPPPAPKYQIERRA
ncbi:MAG: GIY-YIG nuclease family protein, partial [Patescibacteria group bacterium]|nr:GIY-YIG nuclease family protein [Patescibacteria group bacterium]